MGYFTVVFFLTLHFRVNFLEIVGGLSELVKII